MSSLEAELEAECLKCCELKARVDYLEAELEAERTKTRETTKEDTCTQDSCTEFSAGPLATAIKDERLCEHFCGEPSTRAAGKHRVRIVRVGKESSNGIQPIRSRSIGITTYLKGEVLWGAEETPQGTFYFGRVKRNGQWGEVIVAESANLLAKQCLRAVGAAAKSRVSPADFFAYAFFRNLEGKYTHPPVPLETTCFICAATGDTVSRWRFDKSLARRCENCREREVKKSRNTSAAEDTAGKEQDRLVTASIVSSGLQYHQIHEMWLNAHEKVPISERLFYKRQVEFVLYMARYGIYLRAFCFESVHPPDTLPVESATRC